MITSTERAVPYTVAPLVSVAAIMLCASTALAQNATQPCRPPRVIPLAGTEPAATIVVDPPLPDPLASRGVVVIAYCAVNMRIAPVFGPGALAVSPRVGHIHVTVDGAPWHWADASGTPLILRGLPPGPHKVLIELVDANHQPVDKAAVEFEVPKKAAADVPYVARRDRGVPSEVTRADLLGRAVRRSLLLARGTDSHMAISRT